MIELVLISALCHVPVDRNPKAVREFQRQTGYPKGRRGYVVDHVCPLACGGADTPANMQWQTYEESRKKDRTERTDEGFKEFCRGGLA